MTNRKEWDELRRNWVKNYTADDIPLIQAQISAMIGDSWLAKSAIGQPADFYIDTRVGKLPYAKRDILRAVELLVDVSLACGLDPHNLEVPQVLSRMLYPGR